MIYSEFTNFKKVRSGRRGYLKERHTFVNLQMTDAQLDELIHLMRYSRNMLKHDSIYCRSIEFYLDAIDSAKSFYFTQLSNII